MILPLREGIYVCFQIENISVDPVADHLYKVGSRI